MPLPHEMPRMSNFQNFELSVCGTLKFANSELSRPSNCRTRRACRLQIFNSIFQTFELSNFHAAPFSNSQTVEVPKTFDPSNTRPKRRAPGRIWSEPCKLEDFDVQSFELSTYEAFRTLELAKSKSFQTPNPPPNLQTVGATGTRLRRKLGKLTSQSEKVELEI